MTLRKMQLADLDIVRAWLSTPEVARWYLPGSTIDRELEDLRRSIAGEQPTEVLVVVEQNEPIGWCQWYLCGAYPDHAAALGAEPEDAGIDYAIGEPGRRQNNLGTAVVAALVAHVRKHHPSAGIIADPEATNIASRKVLEKNGFQLVDERPVASEPTPAPMAIYRLAPATEARR
ncbi:GNAT family N-acetyltransferase [Mycobacterium branderi]|uniref:GNAT family N-acetyltransferase n=1 Tax=Mycobacterium branderi TaxID=43348 RepID=UPI0013D2466B|nr:GNAT family N-acetyltransferase [Mycobacterium branderi]MCV7235733.1 GNAT family N-acetyltransferase [Mycobacterium branderi]